MGIVLNRKVFLFVLGCLNTLLVTAQSYKLELTDNSGNIFFKKLKLKDSYPDSVSIVNEVSQVLSLAHKEGYLLAELSEIRWSGSRAVAFFNLHQRYQLVRLSNGNIPSDVLRSANFSISRFKDSYYNQDQIDGLFEDLLNHYSDNGYPFASVYLDSIKLNEGSIEAAVYADPGVLFVIDSVKVTGSATVLPSFLQSYLNLKPGSVYSESNINSIERRLEQLPFLKILKKPGVKFAGNKAQVELFLDKQDANRFDGIIGFLPDNSTGKLQLTGDIRLHLNNVFKRADLFDFSFKGLPAGSRELNLAAGFSELFSTPAGLNIAFNLYRQDTSFQNISSRLGLNYRLYRGNLSLFLQNRSSSIPGNNPAQNQSPYADVRYVSYGAGYHLNTLNSLITPVRGFTIDTEAEAGRRNASGNSAAAELKADSSMHKSNQYRIKGSFSVYYPLSKHGVIKFSNETGLLVGKSFFENELYRIGGFNNLRGFDEQSILASDYSVFNLEYRFLIESNSFLFLFINQGLIKRSALNASYTDTPLGFGTGINLQTKAGIFSLSYALGKQKDNPLNLQKGKIHFGLISLF